MQKTRPTSPTRTPTITPSPIATPATIAMPIEFAAIDANNTRAPPMTDSKVMAIPQ